MSQCPPHGYYIIQSYEHNNVWGLRGGSGDDADWVVGFTSGIALSSPKYALSRPETHVWRVTRENPGYTLQNVHTGLYLGSSEETMDVNGDNKLVVAGVEEPAYWKITAGRYPGTFQLRPSPSVWSEWEVLQLNTYLGEDDAEVVISEDANCPCHSFRFCVASPPPEKTKPESSI